MTTIKNVQVSESNEGLLATITSTSAMSEVAISTMPGKLIVDIKNSKSQLNNQITPSTNTYVQSIRTSQFTSDTTRVVLDLKSGAQIKTDITEDRTQLLIQLTPQNLEEVTISTSNGQDRIYFKGLGTTQMAVEMDKANQKLAFTLPHTMIKNNVTWTNIKSNLISKITMTQSGSDIKGIVELTDAANYSLENGTNGAYIVLKGVPAGDSKPEQGTPEQVPDQEKPNEGQTPDKNEPNEDNQGNNQPEQVVNGLTYTSGSKPQITLGGIKGSIVSQIKVTDDYRNRKLIFDLGADYSAQIKTQTLTINDAYIKTISVSNPGKTIITVETKTVYTYNMIQGENSVGLQLVKPQQKYNQIVVLDLGHGGSDAGAVANGLKEKEVNFNQGMALYKLLEADPNIKVYMTRETDVYPTLQFRSTLANEIEADLFISIHNNSAAASVSGTETLYFPSTTDTRGKAIAQLVQKAIVNNCNMIDRGIKARSDLHVLKTTNMPAILIETGFLSNVSDASRINSSSFINIWAKAVYNAVVEGFKLL